jgi:glycosyltransferase involved in cell wall biosynthesis
MTVTVAMPYYCARPWVEQAVRSVLSQTHRDLRLIVIADGECPPLQGVHDKRMTVYELKQNRGAYFAMQLALLASPDEWHAPHASDDWTDPEHLESLLALGMDAVALRTAWVHTDKGAKVESIGNEGWHTGVFLRERLWSLGGYDPSARVSQDTNVLKLLDDNGGYHRHRSDNPTYHIRRRPGSLTTAPQTGLHSRLRMQQRSKDAKIRAKVRGKTYEQIRAYRASLVPPALMAELNQHAKALRALL